LDHDGSALAADQSDPRHRRPAGLPSVHVRVLVTWVAIFPLVALGMSVFGLVGEGWPPVLRALVLTAIVVPASVYLLVPWLLTAVGRVGTHAANRRATRRRRRIRRPSAD
jgi:antibiotic biosynthesis monooxygenase (ABM) superfamily enzyme